MITIAQIKAARALIDWTQRDLAKQSGISLSAIAQIERGAGNPRAETMRILQKTFEASDVEFSDDPGIRIRQDPFSTNIWRGRDAILRIWEDIESSFNDGNGGDLLLSSLDDAIWEKHYAHEMQDMLARRKKLHIKTLALIGAAKDNRGLPAGDCRIVPKAIVTSEVPFYVYKDKVAIIKARMPIRVILVKNQLLAESFRAQFYFHWNNGKKL